MPSSLLYQYNNNIVKSDSNQDGRIHSQPQLFTTTEQPIDSMASSREAVEDRYGLFYPTNKEVFAINRTCEALQYWRTRPGHCSFKNITKSRFEDIKSSSIHKVQDPGSLLGPNLYLSEAKRNLARALIERLRELPGNFGENYELKSDALRQLLMRLIILPDSYRPRQPQPESYIALSYRWSPMPVQREPLPQSSPSVLSTNRFFGRMKSTTLKKSNHYPKPAGAPSLTGVALNLPCSEILFEGLLRERNSADEGVWIDRYCIDQENESEKKIAIPAMDIIYKAARRVVVIIEDIVISHEEEKVLRKFVKKYEASPAVAELTEMVLEFSSQNHGALNFIRSEEFRADKSPEYRPVKEAIAFQRNESKWIKEITNSSPFQSFVRKLYSASWFDRAWCAHEFRMSKRHIFLIPCQRKNTLMRFDGAFLLRILEIINRHEIRPDIGGTEGPLKIKARAKVSDYLMRLFKIETRAALQSLFSLEPESADGDDGEDPETLMSAYLTQSYKETMFLGAGGDPNLAGIARVRNGMRDKLSIILNTAGLNVYYNGDGLDEDDCLRNIVMCSLASQDGSILTTTGPPIRCPGGNSWIQNVTYDDWSRDPQLPSWDSEEISIGMDNGLEYVSLPLSFTPAEMSWLDLKGDYAVPDEVSAGEDSTGQALDQATSAFGLSLSSFLVLSMFERDIDFIITNPELNHAHGLLEVLQPESLKKILVNTFTCYLRFQGGLSGEPGMQLPHIPADLLVFDTFVLTQAFNRLFGWISECTSLGGVQPSTTLREDVRHIFSYLSYVVEEALPPPSHRSMFSMTWEPFVICERARDESKILLFLPLPHNVEEKVHVAIPTGLLREEFALLPRVWILVKKNESSNSSWHLLAKTKILWDAERFCARLSGMAPRSQQRVYGLQDATTTRPHYS